MSRRLRFIPEEGALALTEGKILEGLWFDRTQEYAARRRGEDFSRLQYATRRSSSSTRCRAVSGPGTATRAFPPGAFRQRCSSWAGRSPDACLRPDNWPYLGARDAGGRWRCVASGFPGEDSGSLGRQSWSESTPRWRGEGSKGTQEVSLRWGRADKGGSLYRVGWHLGSGLPAPCLPWQRKVPDAREAPGHFLSELREWLAPSCS